MKITRRQLRQIIESSVIKRGDDYVAPVEAPLTDPRDYDFDLSDENKEKLHALAGSDPNSGGPAQADSLADTLDFPSSGRFGADTLSMQTKMYDMGLDLINDPEVDQLLDRAIELSVKDNYSEHITDDLIYVLNAGYKYPEGPGGFQLFLNGDPDFNDENLDTEWGGLNTTVFHPGRPAITSDLITFVMRKMYFLIGIKLTGIQDSMRRDGTSALELVDDFSSDRNVEELAPEYLKQRFEKFEKVKELFKKRTSKARYPAVAQHVYDKLMKPMYEIFTSAHKAYKHVDPEIDMSQIKESKLGDNMKLNRKSLRRLIMEEIEILAEAPENSPFPYRAKVMLGLVPGVDVLPTSAVEEPWNSDDDEHRALYVALQDLGDIVMPGSQNSTGQVQLRQEKLRGGERLPFLMDKLNIAKSIIMDSVDPSTERKWFVREEDALVHFITELGRVLTRESGGPDFSVLQ